MANLFNRYQSRKSDRAAESLIKESDTLLRIEGWRGREAIKSFGREVIRKLSSPEFMECFFTKRSTEEKKWKFSLMLISQFLLKTGGGNGIASEINRLSHVTLPPLEVIRQILETAYGNLFLSIS
ncbi:hypothetical protein NPIL_60341 [Nephila pilipes]|uniref:Uncharacterized protein n=1 Tax=Nephila pilipes TaxID=299642 RepID=A0A8X6NKB7_NEPPI|nr:hypothetical protein NPIL_60341 [Nephila pilipes]